MSKKSVVDMDEDELRRAVGLPARRGLSYKRLTERGVQSFPVASVRAVAPATSPAACPLEVVLENGKVHTVLASFFADMQRQAFGIDGKER